MVRFHPSLTPPVVLLLALATTTLASCGSDSGDGTDSGSDAGTVSASDLDGKTFVASEATGHTIVAGTSVQLTFEDGQVSAYAGCNTQTGGYTVEEGTLVIDGALAATRMACPQDQMEQDDWLASLLTSTPAVSLADDTLTIGDDSTGLTLEPLADTPLEGTEWVV